MVKHKDREWYSVRLDTIRAAIAGMLLVFMALGTTLGVRTWRENRLLQSASEIVSNARSLAAQLKNQEELPRHATIYDRAVELLGDAEGALERGELRSAADTGERSFQLLTDIFDQMTNAGEPGVAWFVSVDGDVQYRRGETGQFLNAHPRDFLYEGDYVRSGGGSSAEIYFHYDETRFRLRPNTFFKVSGGGRNDASGSLGFMEYGYVDLNTSSTGSGVTTRDTEITVEGNSRASVTRDDAGDTTTVEVSGGGASVRSVTTGQSVELSNNQRVETRAGVLGEVVTLPPAPVLRQPPDNLSIDIDTTRRMQLRWESVEGADRYALQVSRTRLFGDTIIDTNRRATTIATLGIRDEGTFVWRVAAVDSQGRRGAWSEPWRFRVASWRGLALERDETAPELEVEVLLNGTIAILRGKTEPGARLEMNGIPLPVSADGSFSTSEALSGRGLQTLRFRAIDAAGNVTETRERVLLPD